MRYIAFLFVAVLIAACGSAPTTTNSSNASNTANASPVTQSLAAIDRPQRIKDMMAARGEQDSAQPTLSISEPAANSTLSSSTVQVKLELAGDLKGYQPHKDPETQMGNHIHVILDNQPYEAYYELGQPFELRNVSDGDHTLRVFPSRPWHESFKNNGAFQMVKFTVKNGGAEANKGASTNGGQQMSTSNTSANTNAGPAREGKDMQNSTAGVVDAAKPLLTYSRPKGEYKGADAENIMIDFWLANAQLKGDGGQFRVRYSVDGGEAKYVDKWAPIWLSGWTAGKHSIKLELVDDSGNAIDNGGYNSTTRDITITK
jgi:PBP1b-binding outer membrane lipoprotein LpoB